MSLLLPHPGEILKPYFEQKKVAKPNYSLRALARDLSLSPGFVSQVFSGQRSPSLSAAENFAKVLKVRKSDASVLRKSVALYSGDNKDARKVLNEYLKQDSAAIAFKKYNRKDMAPLQYLTKWYQVALMELITCDKYQSDERLMAQKLKISLTELRASLFTLVNAGLIEKANGKWKMKVLHQDFPTDTTHEATRQYHRTMTGKALEVLSEEKQSIDISRRRIIGATLAVNPEHLEKAIHEYNEFIYKMTSLLTEGDCSEVYQINLQLFPLTKKEI